MVPDIDALFPKSKGIWHLFMDVQVRLVFKMHELALDHQTVPISTLRRFEGNTSHHNRGMLM